MMEAETPKYHTDCRGPWGSYCSNTLVDTYIGPCWGLPAAGSRMPAPEEPLERAENEGSRYGVQPCFRQRQRLHLHKRYSVAQPVQQWESRPKSAVACAVFVGQKENDSRRNFFLGEQVPTLSRPKVLQITAGLECKPGKPL